jgi:hypothetical protein
MNNCCEITVMEDAPYARRFRVRSSSPSEVLMEQGIPRIGEIESTPCYAVKCISVTARPVLASDGSCDGIYIVRAAYE